LLLEALSRYPHEGLTRELLALGMSWVVMEAGLEPDKEELIEALEGALNSLESRTRINTSKIGRNDRNSFNDVLQAWFNRSTPETYGELFELVIRETIKLLKEDKIDPSASLSTIKTDKNGTYLGVVYKEKQAILPAILKQPEYYEYQSSFLKPTTARKAQIRMDPLWFSFMALGFFTSFAGFISGKYYLITKPGIEGFWPYEVEDIIEHGILPLTSAGASGRISLTTEELYEMKLAMKLAEEEKNIIDEVYPVTLHVISLEGQSYTELKTIQLNLIELNNYITEYVKKIRASKVGSMSLLVELKEGGATVKKYPLWALVDIAEKEVWKGVKGDEEMLAYIFVKDLYRAINSGKKDIIQDSIFRLFRQGRALLEGSSRGSGEFRKVMRTFMWEEHLGVLL